MSSTQPKNLIDTRVICSVPIFSTVIQDFDQMRRAAFMNLILTHKMEHPGITASNQYGWHSESNFHLQNDEHIRWFNAKMGDFVRASLNSLSPVYQSADILLTSCWANVSEYQAWNAPHNHMPSHWSGVFYVSAEDCQNHEDKSDKTGKIDFMNPLPMGKPYGQPLTMTYAPKNGMALLFPAYLMHFVHPNYKDEIRISMAFNLDIRFNTPPAPGKSPY